MISKSDRAKLNALLREAMLLRDGGRCLRCGRTDYLQASHIYPKGKYRKMEFELDNIKTLCNGCHLFWWHKHPMEAKDWLEEKLPPQRLQRLKMMAMYVDKSPIDVEMLCIYLKKEIERLNNA